jgi:hypothetical protein
MGFNIQQYEQAISNNSGGNWSNASGDVADLKQKIKDLETNLNYFEERWTQYSAEYESCRSIKKDKDRNACLTSRKPAVDIADAGRTRVARELGEVKNALATAKIEQANTSGTSPNTGGGTTGGGTTGGGTTGGGTTGGGTTAKKSNTVLYASIGGAVLILGVVGYFVFRNK